MNLLPAHKNLPVEYLIETFKNTTSSYKYYWFLSLLEKIKESNFKEQSFYINDVIIKMISLAWYPVNYFRLSFGKTDRLSNIVIDLQDVSGFPAIDKLIHINDVIVHYFDDSGEHVEIRNKLVSLGRYVPYRFISPWFSKELMGKKDSEKNDIIVNSSILKYEDSVSGTRLPLYRFDNSQTSIEFHPDWLSYFKNNYEIVRGFVLWNLLRYMQKNNPAIPNLSEKLFEPQKRDLNTAIKFWKTAFNKEGIVTCIYTNELVSLDKISIDHFLPWSFTCHDLLWNLIPTTPSVNSSKSDKLPDLNLYFKNFSSIQFQAMQNILKEEGDVPNKFTEDYIALFKLNSKDELRKLNIEQFSGTLQETLFPLFSIAATMGFQKNWQFKI